MKLFIGTVFLTALIIQSCEKTKSDELEFDQWTRTSTPVLRDSIASENYQVASDAHVFVDGNSLQMIYSGDKNGKSSIKLARSNGLDAWRPSNTLLGSVGPSGLDVHKETAYYRKASTGKHQIYYIGYEDETAYEAQIFLAEADVLDGPYTQMKNPVVAKGNLAGKQVYCMTSPSVVEHEGTLYMTFIGWNDAPKDVTEVWIIGATSQDHGHTWNDFQLVDTRIGMEGQVTKAGENQFIAVRTGDLDGKEAIYYSRASHPFGPWNESEHPILIQAGPPYEKDEIIAPQIFIDPESGDEVLFYTGADYSIGWWIMLAKK